MATVQTDLKAQDIMTSEPVCVDPAMTLRDLAQLFAEHEISGAPVIDAEGRVIGVVSMTDLLRRCIEGTLDIPPAYLFDTLSEQSDEDEGLQAESQVHVEDFMTDEPVTVTATTRAGEIARIMSEGRIHRVIVVDDERMAVGIVTSLDLLAAFGR